MEGIISVVGATGDADELSLYVFLKINFQSSSDDLHGSVVCIVKTDSKKLPKKSFCDRPNLLNKTNASSSRNVCNVCNF